MSIYFPTSLICTSANITSCRGWCFIDRRETRVCEAQDDCMLTTDIFSYLTNVLLQSRSSSLASVDSSDADEGSMIWVCTVYKILQNSVLICLLPSFHNARKSMERVRSQAHHFLLDYQQVIRSCQRTLVVLPNKVRLTSPVKLFARQSTTQMSLILMKLRFGMKTSLCFKN